MALPQKIKYLNNSIDGFTISLIGKQLMMYRQQHLVEDENQYYRVAYNAIQSAIIYVYCWNEEEERLDFKFAMGSGSLPKPKMGIVVNKITRERI